MLHIFPRQKTLLRRDIIASLFRGETGRISLFFSFNFRERNSKLIFEILNFFEPRGTRLAEPGSRRLDLKIRTVAPKMSSSLERSVDKGGQMMGL